MSLQRFAAFFLAMMAVATVTALHPAAAKGENGMYTVRDIDVDASADTAAAARDKAIAQGARKGLEQLMRQLAADPAKPLPPVTDKTAAPLVQDFEVESERSSTGRYIARLGFRYKPESVRALLFSSGGHFITTRAPLLLVVPVYRSANGDLLWQTGNPWLEAWKNAATRAGLVPIVVPAGTPEDTQAFTTADYGDAAKLAALADRYHADNAVIVFATAVSPTGDPGGGLTLTLSGGGGPDASFKSDGAPSPVQALGTGVTASLAEFDLLWKQHVLKAPPGAIAFKANGAVTGADTAAMPESQPSGSGFALQAALAGPGEWAALRTRLAQATGITRVDLKSLTRDAVIVVVNVSGDEDQLTQVLSTAGLTLGPPQAVPAGDGQLASMVPENGPGAGLIYPLTSTGPGQ